MSTPAIAEGRVFVNAEDPGFGLWAFDAITGRFLWRNQRPGEPESTVTVANDVVYDIADSGELMMFEAAQGTFLGFLADPSGKPFRSRLRLPACRRQWHRLCCHRRFPVAHPDRCFPFTLNRQKIGGKTDEEKTD